MTSRFTDSKHPTQTGRGLLKFAVVSLTTMTLLALPTLIQAQNAGSGQSPPGKSQSPPPPKQSSPPPPATGGKSSAPPPAASSGQSPGAGQAAPAPPAAPIPKGPIANDDDPRVKAAVAKAVNFLRNSTQFTNDVGHLGLIVHALSKVREKFPDLVPPNDPTLLSLIEKLRARCTGAFQAGSPGGHDNYEAGVVACAWAAADGQLYKSELDAVAQYILEKQKKDTGGWGYDSHSNAGDTSQTQYAILGLWEAGASGGVKIDKSVWDRIGQWLIKTQHPDGGFEYNPPGLEGSKNTGHATHTMAVASLGSLYICRDHLAPGGKVKNTRGQLLQTPDDEENRKQAAYKGATTPDQLNSAIDKANDWLAKNFTLFKATGEADQGGGVWFFYYLYAFERFGTLSEQKIIAGHDWYAEGAEAIIGRQQAGGQFTPGYDATIDTCFATLFLIRSTHISQKIHQKRIGKGTLVSGRGLPQNLAELEQTSMGFKAKAVKGTTGKLLELLETGKQEELEGAALGLVKKMYEEKEKWTAVGEQGDQLKKIYERGVKLKSAEMIKAAMKGLAMTKDYRVVPILIDGMYYEDDADVQLEARRQLCVISRKFNGFGAIYPDEATKEEWEQEIERWKEWYHKVRPEAAFEDEVEIGK